MKVRRRRGEKNRTQTRQKKDTFTIPSGGGGDDLGAAMTFGSLESFSENEIKIIAKVVKGGKKPIFNALLLYMVIVIT